MQISTSYVYITTNAAKKTLYTGVTNNLIRRIVEHYQNKGKPETFAGKYYSYWLVYYEEFPSITQAIEREKDIKNMSHDDKVNLINGFNPTWMFLNKSILGLWRPNLPN